MRRYFLLLLFCLSALAVFIAFPGGKSFDSGPDLTSELHYLGNPYLERYPGSDAVYARNIWDMQLYDGRIFLGAGNSSNEGPAQNAGPVPIIAYDLRRERFVTEGAVSDEQIDIYKPIGGRLYLPGHDATGSWKWGNFYVRTSKGQWRMYRNIPGALHVYDLAEKNGQLLAGVGLSEGAAVLKTEDNGTHWRKTPLGKGRVYAFMPLGDTLLALKKFKRTQSPFLGAAQEMNDGTFSARFDISSGVMFPETVLRQTYAKAVRITPVGDQTLYIGGYKNNDHQTLPFGLYIARMHAGRFDARRITLPDGVIPRDLLVRGDRVYMLSQRTGEHGTVIGVWRASMQNLLEWKELFHFRYATFARSFERANGVFYFGMGCDVNPQHRNEGDLPKQAGDILQIAYPDSGGGT